ncbi:MAG TPA: ABC transporter ATP-binding protein [Planctomycetota bacterium]|nr:ABC transporter ATP-binding protein [Planctomycetota bacterium]
MNTWVEEELEGRGYDRRLMRRFLGFLRPHAKWVGVAFAFVALRIACDLASAPILRWTVDGPIAEGRIDELLTWCGLFGAAILGMALFEYLEIWVTNLVGQRLIFDLRLKVFGHVQRLPQSFHDKNPVGRLLIRVTNDVENLNELFTSGLVAAIADILLIAGVLAMMFAISWKLALVTLAPAPLTVIAVLIFRTVARRQYRDLRVKIARLNAFLNESVNGMRTIQMFTRELACFGRFRALSDDYRSASNKSVLTYSVFFPTVDFLSAVSGAILLGYGGLSIMDGSLSFGSFLAFWYLAQKFFFPVRDLSEKYNILQAAMASSERLFDLLDTPAEKAPERAGAAPPSPGSLVFDRVSFSYDGVTPVLQDLSFSIRPGERVALVGVTGAGKTTITSLLLRLYEATSGRVLVDGVDVRDRDPVELRRRFGLVLQDVFLFAGSVEDNIRLGDASIGRERVEAAARAAGADRFVAGLPGGFAADVRERGSALSSGQRQLLSVARALARDPGILILDEATSSVDTESERRFQEALEVLLKGRTALVIAHRLSTIRRVDRIFVLHHGRLAEQGPHEELMRKDGVYAKLYRLQFEGLRLPSGSIAPITG